MFKDAGYATAASANGVIGGRGTSGVCRRSMGSTSLLGYYDQVHAHTFFPKYLVRNSEEVPLAGNTGDNENRTNFQPVRDF